MNATLDALDTALISFLHSATPTQIAQTTISDAFASAVLEAAGGSINDIPTALEMFLSSSKPTPLEELFVRVATTIHCHTLLATFSRKHNHDHSHHSGKTANGNSSGITDTVGAASSTSTTMTTTLPSEIKAAALALATTLHSPQLGCTSGGDGNSNGNGHALSSQRLWYAFLCVFLQQLSSRGGDYATWREFFHDCANEAQTKVPKANPSDSQDHCGHKDYIVSPSVAALAAWGAVSEETFNATVARTRFRRTAILCKSFCPHMVAQSPGTTFQLLHTFHAFMDEWKKLQLSYLSTEGVEAELQGNEQEAKEAVASKEKEEEVKTDATVSTLLAAEDELLRRYSANLGHLLGSGQTHTYLLSTTVGAVLSSTYIFPRRSTQSQASMPWWGESRPTSVSESRWRSAKFPPIGRLLDRLHLRPLLTVHLFVFSSQLCIGLAPAHHADSRRALALCAYLTEVCDLRAAFSMYHFAAQTLGIMDTATAPLPGESLAEFTRAMCQYVSEAHSELVQVPTSNNQNSGATAVVAEAAMTMRRRLRHGNATSDFAARVEEDPLPVSGEMFGPRFSRMVFPLPCPTWQQFLVEDRPIHAPTSAPVKSAATVTSTPPVTAEAVKVTPCRFVLELLEMSLPKLAAQTIAQFREEAGVDVCLVPSVALHNTSNYSTANTHVGANGSASVTVSTMRHVQSILDAHADDNASDAFTTLRALESYLPLLTTTAAYLASQTFLFALLEKLAVTCSTFVQKASPPRSRWALGLVELYLIQVVMPCMRVIPPSPVLYDSVQELLLLLQRESPLVKFGPSPAESLHTSEWLRFLSAPSSSSPLLRAPHDALRSKELEALFSQSLKRMTQANVARYRDLLQPVIYANPLLVGEKLFQQAVGYGNNFLQLHTQLLRGAPAAIMTLVAHAGLFRMRHYADTERIGTNDASRVGLIATFLAVLWRDNPESFDKTLLLRATEYALRREARASIVFGLEMLKSVLHEMLDVTPEHEEQYTTTQVRALLAPPSTQWFAKGAAESFRRGRWDAVLTPAVLAASGALLRTALLENCAVPLEVSVDNLDEETMSTESNEGKEIVIELTLGQWLLLHLCRLHSKIYKIQADLAGTMELVLLTCARDYNVINDLLWCLESQLPVGPPAEELLRVAMPHVALRLSALFAVKARQKENQGDASKSSPDGVSSSLIVDALFTVSPTDLDDHILADEGKVWHTLFSGINGAIPFTILRRLSRYTAAHFVYEESIYTVASKEVNHFFNHATALLKKVHTNGGALVNLSRDPTVRWLQDQTRQIRLEKEAHRKLYEQCDAAREALLADLRIAGVLKSSEAFAISYLLPRALLSLEDTLFVFYFLKWLLDATRPVTEDYVMAISIVLSLVTAAMTFFVGFTDGECKRVGLLLGLICTSLHDPAEMIPPPPHILAQMAASTGIVTTKTSTTATIAAGGGGSTMAATTSGEGTGTVLGSAAGGDNTVLGSFTMDSLMAHLDPKPRPLTDILSGLSKGSNKTNRHRPSANKTEQGDAKTKEDEVGTEKKASPPAYPLQLEAYVCRALVQLLVHQKDVHFLHRNTFLVLERLVKNNPPFPSTLCATSWLIRAVTPHAVQNSSCYASATAALKVLQDCQQRKRRLLQELQPSSFLCAPGIGNSWGGNGIGSATGVTSASNEAAEEEWRKLWNTREMYMRWLLAADMDAADRQRGGVQDEFNTNEEEGGAGGVAGLVEETLDEAHAVEKDLHTTHNEDEEEEEMEEENDSGEDISASAEVTSQISASPEGTSSGMSAHLVPGRKRPREEENMEEELDGSMKHADNDNASEMNDYVASNGEDDAYGDVMKGEANDNVSNGHNSDLEPPLTCMKIEEDTKASE